MKQKSISFMIVLVSTMCLIFFQNFTSTTPSPAVSMPTPSGYATTGKCAVYAVIPKYAPMKIGEVFVADAIRNPNNCRRFVETYYLPIPNCGYKFPLFFSGKPEEYSVIGVLEASDTITTQFSVSSTNVYKVTSPVTSVMSMGPKACTQVTVINSPFCNYGKTNFCVNASSPIFYQSSKDLVKYISTAENNPNIKTDMGWCGPTSTAMSLLGSILPEELEIHYDNALWKRNLPKDDTSKMDINERTALYGNLIYNVGKYLGTNWEKGGSNTDKGIKSLFKRIDPSIRNLNKTYYNGAIDREFYILNRENVNLDNLISKFSKGRNTTVLSTQKYKQACSYTTKETKRTAKLVYFDVTYTCNSTTAYQPLPTSHAISVNGIEDGYVKVYDPWGRIYNIDIQDGSKLKRIPVGNSVLSYVSGEKNGYMGDNQAPPPRSFVIPVSDSIDKYAQMFGYRYINTGIFRGFTTSIRTTRK